MKDDLKKSKAIFESRLNENNNASDLLGVKQLLYDIKMFNRTSPWGEVKDLQVVHTKNVDGPFYINGAPEYFIEIQGILETDDSGTFKNYSEEIEEWFGRHDYAHGKGYVILNEENLGPNRYLFIYSVDDYDQLFDKYLNKAITKELSPENIAKKILSGVGLKSGSGHI